MYVNADWEIPVYQVIGPIVRVHWNYVQREVDYEGMAPWTTFDIDEAVVPTNAPRDKFVRIVDAQGGPGESLADGWFS